MKKNKTIALFLALLTLFSCTSFSASAVGAKAERSEVEALAATYIENYVNTIYCYETHDFSKGTLKEALSVNENLRATQMPATLNAQEVELFGQKHSAAELCEKLSTVAAYADYMKYIRSEQNIVRENFNVDISTLDCNIDGDSAYVHLYTYITFYYENDPEMAEMGDNYCIHFTNLNGKWIIANVEVEEIAACGYGDILYTADAKAKAFDKWFSTAAKQPNAPTTTEEQSRVIVAPYRYTYNRNNAVAYAYTYTTSGYSGSGNNTSFLNPIFPDYTNNGGNCMNFVSQCLWAGLKGDDIATAISNQEAPMHVGTSGWYYTSSGNRSASWSGTLSFKSYVNSITSSSAQGLVTSRYTISAGTSFSAVSLTTLPGSIILVNSDSHAAIITSASSSSYSDIKICENSPMRKGIKLTDRGYQTSAIYLIVPAYMILPATCGSHTDHNFQTDYAGCTRCSYTKLSVTGTMYQPVSVNTTLNLTGSANMNCYRMAIGITSPSGNTTWHEATNTSSIVKSYKFTETGLYTITISARDVTDIDPLSSADSHIFKIRIY